MPSSPQRVPRALGVLAIAGAAIWTWTALPRIDHPMGSDWAQYFTVAEILWHDDPHLYPPFRKPFFGMLLGLVGEDLGYLNAAQILGRLSAVVTVLAAGVGAWALVGPLAGAVAAIAVVLMPLVMDGALWVNNYPVLGACCSVALGAGAALSRWPRVHWAVLAGLGAGAANALDVRGLVVLPAVAALLAIGLPWGEWRRVVLLCVALATPVVGLSSYDSWLVRTHDVPLFSLQGQLRVQRQAVLEPIRRGQYVQTPALQAACRSAEEALPWREALYLWSEGSCADAIRTFSYESLVEDRFLPAPLTLWLLPLVLLPVARRRDQTGRGLQLRSSLASLVVFGVPAGAVLLGMGWVFYFDRYLLPWAAVLAMGIPVALGRAGALLPGLWAGMRWVAAAGALVWVCQVWPGMDARSLQAPETIKNADHAAGVMARWASAEVAEADSIVDCGGLAMDYLLLPRRIDYERHPPGDPVCNTLIRQTGSTTGRTFLITPVLPGQTGLAATPSAITRLGWTQIPMPAEVSGYRLWLKEP